MECDLANGDPNEQCVVKPGRSWGVDFRKENTTQRRKKKKKKEPVQGGEPEGWMPARVCVCVCVCVHNGMECVMWKERGVNTEKRERTREREKKGKQDD